MMISERRTTHQLWNCSNSWKGFCNTPINKAIYLLKLENCDQLELVQTFGSRFMQAPSPVVRSNTFHFVVAPLIESSTNCQKPGFVSRRTSEIARRSVEVRCL